MALVEQISAAFTRVGADVKGVLTSLTGKLDASARGAANGVASLGSDGKVLAIQLPEAVLGAMKYQGTWNAATNSPAIPTSSAANRGHYYVVATAGSTAINGESDWKVGDWIVSAGDHWDKLDSSDQVLTVAGRQGNIVLTSSDVGLGSVNNTADSAKPVSTAQQTALNLKANAANAALTGTPTAPTAAATVNTTQVATTAFVRSVTGDPATDFEAAYVAALNA